MLRVVPIFVRIGFSLLRCSGAGVGSGACEVRGEMREVKFSPYIYIYIEGTLVYTIRYDTLIHHGVDGGTEQALAELVPRNTVCFEAGRRTPGWEKK